MTPVPEMFDYASAHQDDGRGRHRRFGRFADLPQRVLGHARGQLQAARIMNDDMAAARKRYGGRIEYFCSLPWQHAELARAELERARGRGAAGVMVLANIAGRPLTAPEFVPVWQAIDALGLPVLIHPTAPPGVARDADERVPAHSVDRVTFDTTLAVSAHAVRRFLRPLHQAEDHRVARRRRAAVPDRAAGSVLPQHSRLPHQDAEVRRQATWAGFSPIRWSSRRRRSTCAWRSSATTRCCSAPTTRTRLATRAGCMRRVNDLLGARREKVRGGNAQRIFGF